jgi:hypothetical protein
VMMDRDNITRTGARAPGVERQIAARTEVLKRIVSPDTELNVSHIFCWTQGASIF